MVAFLQLRKLQLVCSHTPLGTPHGEVLFRYPLALSFPPTIVSNRAPLRGRLVNNLQKNFGLTFDTNTQMKATQYRRIKTKREKHINKPLTDKLLNLT